MFKKTTVSVEINTNNLKVVVAKGNQIIKFGSTSLDSGIVRDGLVTDPQAFGLTIDNFFSSLKLPRDRIVCTITGLPFLYRKITLPSTVSDIDVRVEALTRAAHKEMQTSEEDFLLVWQLMESRASENDFFVVGVKKALIEAIVVSFKCANINLLDIDLKPLCIARENASRYAILACLEQDYFDFIIVTDGLVRAIHSFSTDVEATNNKRLASEFIDGLNKIIRSYNGEFPEKLLSEETPVFLSGKLLSHENTLDVVKNSTNRPVETSQMSLKHPQIDLPMLYINNLGALLKHHPNILITEKTKQYHDISLNVLEPSKEDVKKYNKYAYLALAAACIFMLATLYYANDFQLQKKAEADELDQQIILFSQQLSQEKQQYNLYMQSEADISALKASLVNLQNENRQLLDLRSDFAQDLTLIDSALPADMRVNSALINESEISIDGYALYMFDIFGFTGALENNERFSEAVIKSIVPGYSSDNTTTDNILTTGPVKFHLDVKAGIVD